MKIKDLENRNDLILLQNDGDILELQSETCTEFDGYFVKIEGGEYKEIYGFCGQIPLFAKTAYKIK